MSNTIDPTSSALAGRVPFVAEDIHNWPRFWEKVMDEAQADAPNPGKRIWELLPENIKTTLEEAARIGRFRKSDKTTIAGAIRTVLGRRDFYDDSHFPDVRLSDSDRELLRKRWRPWLRAKTRAVNRSVLAASYPRDVSNVPRGPRRWWRRLLDEADESDGREISWMCTMLFFSVSVPILWGRCPHGRLVHEPRLLMWLWVLSLFLLLLCAHLRRQLRLLKEKLGRIEERLAEADGERQGQSPS